MAGEWSRILPLSAKRRAKDPGDEELVERIQRGDQRAWALFLERYTDLIYQKARSYSRSAQFVLGTADWEDEVGELYLVMAGEVQKSLSAFRGDCQPTTWVHAVVNRRNAILRAYLRDKDPHRADVRIPRGLEGRLSAAEEEIFRHLIWGLEPEDIPLKLDVSRRQCEEVEDRVAEYSPQVYERILENRRKRQPHLSLDTGVDEEEEDNPGLEVPHSGPDPDRALEEKSLMEAVRLGVERALERMSMAERRVQILLYNQGATVEQVVALAALDDSLGLGEIPNANRVYYLKDKGLKVMLEEIYEQLEEWGDVPSAGGPKRRELLKCIEEFILEEGLPEPRA